MSSELPDVVLKEHNQWTSITYRGKGLAWVNHIANTAMIKATRRSGVCRHRPGAFSEGWASTTTAWISVRLERADAQEFEMLA